MRLLLLASAARAALALLPACHELGGAPQLSPRSRASLVTSLFEVAAESIARAPDADAWRARYPELSGGIFDLQAAVGDGRLADPRMLVLGSQFDASTLELRVRWLLSGRWPTGWAQPRLTLHGESAWALGATPRAPPSERWLAPASGPEMFVSQLLKPTAELNRLFALPEVDAPATRRLRAGVAGVEVREIFARPVLRLQVFDDARTRSARIASALPSCAFATLRRQETDATTLEGIQSFEVAVDAIEEDEGADRELRRLLTWTVALPSVFGLEHLANGTVNSASSPLEDADALGDDDERWLAVNRAETAEFDMQPHRTVLAVPFGGDPQDRRAVGVKRALAEIARENGFEIARTAAGRPRFGFRRNEAKLGFYADGGFAVAIHAPGPVSEITLDVVPKD